MVDTSSPDEESGRPHNGGTLRALGWDRVACLWVLPEPRPPLHLKRFDTGLFESSEKSKAMSSSPPLARKTPKKTSKRAIRICAPGILLHPEEGISTSGDIK